MSLLGPLTAYLPIPRDGSGRPLISTLEKLADDAILAGATSLCVLGNAAEAAYVPRSGRRHAMRSVVAIAEGRAAVLVGISAFAGADVAMNLDEATQHGVDGVLLQPLSHYHLNSNEAVGLYRAICDITSLGIWIDNTPGSTAYRLSASEIAQIAQFKGIRGIKDAAASASDARHRRIRVLDELPPRVGRRVEYGFTGIAYGAQSLIDSATTWHASLGGVLPDCFGVIAHLVAQGKREQAESRQRSLMSLAMLEEKYGPMRLSHAIGTMRGYDMGSLPLPLLPLPRDARRLLNFTLESLTVPEHLRQENRAAVAQRLSQHMDMTWRSPASTVVSGRHSEGP